MAIPKIIHQTWKSDELLTDFAQENRERLALAVLPRICGAPPTRLYPNGFPLNLHMYARHHFSWAWKDKDGPSQEEWRGWSLLKRLASTELYYWLPPTPVWKSDLCFWKRKWALS